MQRVLFILAIATGAAAILGFGAQPGVAQTRVFVSGSGSDANPCSLSAPCRSFQQAHNTVLAGGEIVALDAAGYGPLNITKAVTVTAIGIEASVTSNSTAVTGISINAGSSDVVVIRGVTVLAGFNGAGDGIDIHSAKSVMIRDCTISGFPGQGVLVDPSASLDVELQGITANNNGVNGLDIVPTASGTVTMLATDSQFNGNSLHGIIVNGGTSTGAIKATLSVAAAANGGNGILVGNTGSGNLVVMVTESKLANNGSGLIANGPGPVHVFVDRTRISGNAIGWEGLSSAVVDSYKNNAVNGNGGDGGSGITQITSE